MLEAVVRWLGGRDYVAGLLAGIGCGALIVSRWIEPQTTAFVISGFVVMLVGVSLKQRSKAVKDTS